MNNHKRTAKIFKALSDESRLSIIELLHNGELCACHISEALGISQSKLSYHMKILCETEIVSCYYLGKWTHYQLNSSWSHNTTELIKKLAVSENESKKDFSCNNIAI